MSVVLSEHLSLLAAAPDGIQKLRGLILELAVRGKLVPQDPNDEPAGELLKRVAKKRARLEEERVCKQSKPMLHAGESAIYSLPVNWQWSTLDPLVRVMDSGWSPACIDNPSPSDDVWGVLKTTAIQTLQYFEQENKELPTNLAPRTECEVAVGDILITRAGPKNRVAISCLVETTRPRLMISDKIIRFHLVEGGMYEKFVALCLNAGATASYLENAKSGMAASQMNITQEKLRAVPIPICSTSEQHRIVSKVDELMALCDRLEAEQMDAEAAHARLVETLLDTLTQSTDATELATNWQRLAEHFDTLFTTESSLDALKQTILQLAVMGKLVPQDPDDEPASDLLKRIAKERTRLQAKGVSKTLKPLPSIGKDNQPSGWDSASLPELCEIGGGATPSKAKSAYWGEGIPWVSPKDMKVDHIFDTQDHVTELALSETRLPRIKPRSLLVVVRGMILLHSFPVATTQIEVAINQDMKSLTPFFPELLPYLALVFRGWKAQILELVDRSTHGTCKLQSEKLFAFRFGIPPLAEQHRIVAKVDELTALCDRLKADLVESRSRQARLSATLIESALQTA